MDSRRRSPGPLKAVARCLARPFTWGGRASPSEFWWFAAAFLIFQAAALAWLVLPPVRVVMWWHAAYVHAEAIGARLPEFPDLHTPIRWMTLDWTIWVLASILPTASFYSALVRRLHDTDHSGWWFWLLLIPGAGIALLLVLLIAPGEMYRNRYGAGRGAAVIVPPRRGEVASGLPAIGDKDELRALRESRMQAG